MGLPLRLAVCSCQPLRHGLHCRAGLQPAAGFGGPPTGRFGGPPATGFGHGGPTFHGSVGRIDASSGGVEQRPFPRTVARGAAAREEDTARLADRMMEMVFVGTNLTLRELPANLPEEEDAQGGGEEALGKLSAPQSTVQLPCPQEGLALLCLPHHSRPLSTSTSLQTMTQARGA